MNMSKDLFLVRGLPSSGKTKLAHKLCANVVSADDYFYDDEGNYNFNANELSQAHSLCREMVYNNLVNGNSVAVANTFTTEKEMKPYFELADKYDYTVTTIIVESRHGNKNDHRVPDETIEKMRNRFSIKL